MRIMGTLVFRLVMPAKNRNSSVKKLKEFLCTTVFQITVALIQLYIFLKTIVHLVNNGDRNPLISMRPNENKMHIGSYVNDQLNYVYNSALIPAEVWTKVRVI